MNSSSARGQETNKHPAESQGNGGTKAPVGRSPPLDEAWREALAKARAAVPPDKRDPLDEDLHGSADVGTPEEVRADLEKGADPNAFDGLEKDTPLHRAALRGDDGVEVARILLAAGAEPDVADDEGFTPLNLALIHGRSALAVLLLERGAKVDRTEGRSWSLWAAADCANTELIRLLLERGEDPQWADAEGWNALCRAVEYGRDEVGKVLLEAGARIPEARAADLELLVACRKGDVRAASLALDKGAHIDVVGPRLQAPVEIAAETGFPDLLRLLSSRGADLRKYDVLNLAAGEGHVGVVQYLLDAGWKATEASRGSYPIVRAASNGHSEAVALLISRGADVNAGEPGYRALHWAIREGHEDVVALLLDRGAEFREPDENGRTPLHMAVDRLGVLRLLIARGALPDARDDFGDTPLHLALVGSPEESVRALVDAGADVNARGEDGLTPLMKAACLFTPGRLGIVELLLERGARANDKTESGKTALDIALQDGHEELADLLVKSGGKGKN